jgi:hypothetical protein
MTRGPCPEGSVRLRAIPVALCTIHHELGMVRLTHGIAGSTSNTTTADVYAGDVASHTPLDGSAKARFLFLIEADAEPGTFARIANVLNIANTAPDRVTLEFNKSARTLSLDIELTIGLLTAQSIQRKLTQLTDVIYAEMRASPPNQARKPRPRNHTD